MQGLGLQVFYKEEDEFRCFANSMIALAFVPPTFLRVAWRGLKREAPVFANQEEFFQYFHKTLNSKFAAQILISTSGLVAE